MSKFTMRVLVTNPELIPLFAMTATVCCMAGSYIYYMAAKKPDIQVNRWNNKLSAPWDVVDPTQKQKLMTVSQKYNPDMKLHQLRREINYAYAPNK
ncbi:normal mucosa of esophagus-specific gene 1 protein-like isoform X2 [Saccoglossus kowalevskii]|uniref:Normal mucosa of esophagus-specific gene 1 protein-like n=1 Tax=Saccoglossus kowalevskii TaxID=10224 RepID=A0ABM0MCZ0_SACKO|nr:PREDICTED: normal mucosa of esophagus-specific gene 1 protein-like [Saccoglossus kowalevskii]